MNKVFLILFFLAAGFFLASKLVTITPANNSKTSIKLDPPPETKLEIQLRDEAVDLLDNNDYVALDAKLNGLQKDYEEGRLSDINLLHIYRGFYDTDPRLEEKYNTWISQHPNSYAARLVRGIYYFRLAGDSRGDKYISQTTKKQLSGMDQYVTKSMEDVRASTRLTAEPVLSYYNAMLIYGLYGDTKVSEQALRAGLAVDPKSYILRFRHLGNLQTRWGGSLKQMVDFRNESKNAGIPAELIQYFDKEIEEEETWLSTNR